MKQTPLKRIRLRHAHNLRDLGGFITNECKIIKWNKLFRADSLTMLEADEWAELLQRGIKTVIDLRSTSETINFPDRPTEGITIYQCPIQNEQLDLKDFSLSALNAFSDSLKEGYREMISTHPELLTCALRTVFNGLEKGAVLFHCSAGKDRTGILAAVLLSLLEAEEEDIIADYEVSYTYNRKGINKMARQFPQFDKIEPLLHSDPENMDRLLKWFNQINLRSFLGEHGISPEEIEKYKSSMLE